MKIFIKTKVQNNLITIKNKFNLDLFTKLAPPAINLQVTRFDGCKKGDEIHLKMNLFGILQQNWTSKITADSINESVFFFIDEGIILPSPLKTWKHVHIVEKINENESWVIDDIEYSCNNSLTDQLIYPFLYAIFYHRKSTYVRELIREIT